MTNNRFESFDALQQTEAVKEAEGSIEGRRLAEAQLAALLERTLTEADEVDLILARVKRSRAVMRGEGRNDESMKRNRRE